MDWTAKLVDAASDDDLQSLKDALKNGADINARYGDSTALIDAVDCGNVEIVKYLVENGADMENMNNIWGNTALMKIANAVCVESEICIEIAQYLLDKGANINAKTRNGWTALMYASSYGYLDMVKFLVKNGANINTITDEGYTALNVALDKEVENFLIEAGAKR